MLEEGYRQIYQDTQIKQVQTFILKIPLGNLAARAHILQHRRVFHIK